MRSRKTLTSAVVLALLLCVALVMTASAAPPPLGKTQIQAQPHALKSIGTTRFAPSRKAPATNKPDAPRYNLNRAVPGKVNKTKTSAPAAPFFPTVKPSAVANTLPGHLSANPGLNAYDTWQANAAVFQPPDQGLCAGNGYVLEMVNEVAAVYDANLEKITGDMSLADFFQLSEDNTGGDPKCYFDPGTKRFFATEIGYGPGENPPGGVPSTVTDVSTFVMVAVSATQDPRLGWYIYALDTTFDCPSISNAPCLPDQPLIGANRDAFFISTNDFQLEGPDFYGTNLYLIDKPAVVAGSLGFLVNVAYWPVGQNIPTPDEGGIWYTLQPAFSANTADWDNRQGGTEYLLSALDFFNQGDNRLALWAMTNTQSIHASPINWNLTLDGTLVSSENYIIPYDFSAQKYDGLIPFGQVYFGATAAGPIQPNDDRMNQVMYTNHILWSGVNTGLMQSFKTGPEYHNGIAYFGVRPMWTLQGGLTYAWVKQGYVSPMHEDVLFPSIAMAPNNVGAMVFTITGPNRYPSAAYTMMTTAGAGAINVANAGMSTYDGSCEYNPACGGGSLDPRWGDYTAAVVMNQHVYMATEYIQTPDCGVAAYLSEGPYSTCGDTRSWRQNWGTALDRVWPY
ncbi:MAG: hypothetical protein WCF84_15170 [Anaerolineae bacterium]